MVNLLIFFFSITKENPILNHVVVKIQFLISLYTCITNMASVMTNSWWISCVNNKMVWTEFYVNITSRIKIENCSHTYWNVWIIFFTIFVRWRFIYYFRECKLVVQSPKLSSTHWCLSNWPKGWIAGEVG